MKQFYTLIFLVLISIPGFSQATYKINSNSNWSSSIPNSCIGCTITISSGAVLTVDQSSTCMNCVFQGGAMIMTNQTLTLLFANSQTTTYFNGTMLTVN